MPDNTGSDNRETRARRKIREAVEARGWTASDIFWDPIAPGSEMAGASGGWEVWIEDKHGESVDTVLGYNWREVVESIEGWSDDAR